VFSKTVFGIARSTFRTWGDWNCLKYCIFACFLYRCTETFWSPCTRHNHIRRDTSSKLLIQYNIKYKSQSWNVLDKNFMLKSLTHDLTTNTEPACIYQSNFIFFLYHVIEISSHNSSGVFVLFFPPSKIFYSSLFVLYKCIRNLLKRIYWNQVNSCMYSFRYFPCVRLWFADVLEPSVSSIFKGWV
jgi:hypothetical protein